MLAILAYYGALDPRLAAMSPRLVRLVPRHDAVSVSEAQGVATLACVGLAQLLFAGAPIALTGIGIAVAPSADRIAAYAALGAVLGLGELGLSSFLARIAIHGASALERGRGPAGFEHWIAMSRGGWMRSYLRTIDALAPSVALGLTATYIVAEEIVFRGVLAGSLAPLGVVWAALGATAAFMVVQAFQMPGWRNALFALSGALVMGITHSALYLEGVTLLPLVIAHITFFWLAVG